MKCSDLKALHFGWHICKGVFYILNSYQRRQMILEIIKANTTVNVNDLIAKFAVTPVTIRKDLTYLENSGMITRNRGTAHLLNNFAIPSFISRQKINSSDKTAIAKAAARLIEDNDSIILDSGTTTLAIAQQIIMKDKLTVITNSIPVSYALASSNVTVLMSGGTLEGKHMSMVGPEAEQYFNKIEADKLFLSASGVRSPIGLTTSSPFQYGVKRQMLKAAKKVYVALDAGKFGSTSVMLNVDFSEVHCLITNKPITDAEILKRLQELNVEIIYANP
jgi:DeoR family transcriptional regulator of aga operon